MSVKPLAIKTHIIFWCCTAVLFVLTILLFKSVLLPFVLGIAVAYLLNPIVTKIEDTGISRAPAAMMILGGFLIILLLFIGIVSPIIYRELVSFSKDLPEYIEKFWEILSPYSAKLDQYIGGASEGSFETLLKDNAGSAANAAKFIVQKIAAGGQALMDVISVAIFMPIVAYFMIAEWPSVTKWVRSLMPRHSEDVIMDLLKKIDVKIAGFVRGQISVAIILGVSYAVMLSLAGLKYGFLIGLMSGVISVIPMVGSIVGLFVSVAVAWFQYGDIMFVGLIAGIFIGGQVIEGNFLTPKLVGDSVGLHPLWVFFALLAGGSLLGVLGMFLSVPVAAVIGVLLTFALQKYKSSAYYLDPDLQDIKSSAMKKTPAKKVSTKSVKKTPVKKNTKKSKSPSKKDAKKSGTKV